MSVIWTQFQLHSFENLFMCIPHIFLFAPIIFLDCSFKKSYIPNENQFPAIKYSLILSNFTLGNSLQTNKEALKIFCFLFKLSFSQNIAFVLLTISRIDNKALFCNANVTPSQGLLGFQQILFDFRCNLKLQFEIFCFKYHKCNKK